MKALIQSIFIWTRASRISKRGQTLAEYALIMAVMSIVGVAVYGLFDTQIAVIFSGIANIIDTAQSS